MPKFDYDAPTGYEDLTDDELRTKLDANRDEALLLTSRDDLTRGEGEHLDRLLKQGARLQREDRKRGAARAAGVKFREPSDPMGAGPTFWKQLNTWGDGTLATAPAELRAQAITAVERTPHADDGRRQVTTEALERAVDHGDRDGNLARWAIAASDPAYLSAFGKVATDPVRGHMEWTADEQRAFSRLNAEMRAMSTTDSAGGYLWAPFVLDPAVRLTNNGQLNPLGSLANVVVIAGTDVWRNPYSAGVEVSWDGEAAAVSDDSPTLAAADITAHKVQGFVPVSIEAFTDGGRVLAEQVTNLFADAFDRSEASVFMSGSGSNQPYGLEVRLDANTNVEVSVTTSGSYGLPDPYKLEAALPVRWRRSGRAAWLMRIDILQATRRFGESLTGNAGFWADLGEGVPPTLLGYPVYEVDAGLDAFTTAGQSIAVLGDYRETYTIVRRAGTQIELIPHLFDVTTARPTGQRGWYAWARTGGDTVVQTGSRLLKS